MAYIEQHLRPGERILCKARVHCLAYVYPIVMFAAVMTFGGLTRLAATELALTDKRVIGKIGSSGRKRIDLPHVAIESVNVKQGLLGLLFDYGTVTISGDGHRVKFQGIVSPVDFKIQVDEAVEVTVLGRTLSQAVMQKF